jgi:hypothetical protein
MELDKIYKGDCLEVIKTFPDKSIDCVVRNDKGQFIKGISAHKSTEFKKGQHWRERKAHWDKEWLFEKYITEKMTIPQLAELCGCTDSNISFWINKHQIPFRSISETRKIKYWGSKGSLNGMYGKTGKLNKNFKGGISPLRQSFYSSLEWKLIVPIIFKRDNYRCRRCNTTHLHKTNPLHIHHIVSFQYDDLRTEQNNLIILCKKCHNWVHSNKNLNNDYILTYEQFKSKFEYGGYKQMD